MLCRNTDLTWDAAADAAACSANADADAAGGAGGVGCGGSEKEDRWGKKETRGRQCPPSGEARKPRKASHDPQ